MKIRSGPKPNDKAVRAFREALRRNRAAEEMPLSPRPYPSPDSLSVHEPPTLESKSRRRRQAGEDLMPEFSVTAFSTAKRPVLPLTLTQLEPPPRDAMEPAATEATEHVSTRCSMPTVFDKISKFLQDVHGHDASNGDDGRRDFVTLLLEKIVDSSQVVVTTVVTTAWWIGRPIVQGTAKMVGQVVCVAIVFFGGAFAIFYISKIVLAVSLRQVGLFILYAFSLDAYSMFFTSQSTKLARWGRPEPSTAVPVETTVRHAYERPFFLDLQADINTIMSIDNEKLHQVIIGNAKVFLNGVAGVAEAEGLDKFGQTALAHMRVYNDTDEVEDCLTLYFANITNLASDLTRSQDTYNTLTSESSQTTIDSFAWADMNHEYIESLRSVLPQMERIMVGGGQCVQMLKGIVRGFQELQTQYLPPLVQQAYRRQWLWMGLNRYTEWYLEQRDLRVQLAVTHQQGYQTQMQAINKIKADVANIQEDLRRTRDTIESQVEKSSSSDPLIKHIQARVKNLQMHRNRFQGRPKESYSLEA